MRLFAGKLETRGVPMVSLSPPSDGFAWRPNHLALLRVCDTDSELTWYHEIHGSKA